MYLNDWQIAQQLGNSDRLDAGRNCERRFEDTLFRSRQLFLHRNLRFHFVRRNRSARHPFGTLLVPANAICRASGSCGNRAVEGRLSQP